MTAVTSGEVGSGTMRIEVREGDEVQYALDRHVVEAARSDAATRVAENHIPGDTWEFNQAVTDDFDKMLLASIPGYRDMRRWTDAFLHDHVMRELDAGRRPVVVDLGASRAEATARLEAEWGDQIDLHLVEVSGPMLDVLNAAYAGKPHVRVHDLDLRYRHDAVAEWNPSTIVCSLTTIFTPIMHRQAILKSVHAALVPRHGRFIWIEKVLGDTFEGDEHLKQFYYAWKSENGYTEEAIQRKKLSLEFAQVPLTSEWNEQLLDKGGFEWRQKFWQNLNFCGWVAGA